MMATIAPWHIAVLLLIAPMTEEVIFRLGLHETLLQKLAARHWVNLGVALVFALAHALVQQTWMGLAVAIPAMLIGEVYGRTRRLMPCVLMHAAMNACWLIWSVNTNGQVT